MNYFHATTRLVPLACSLLAACGGGALLATPARIATFPAEEGFVDPRAFEIEDYYRTAFVGAPSVAPDGNSIVFAVRRYDVEKEESWSEIWMMLAEGGKARRMTSGRHSDSSPSFSPDGERILFVSDRSESSQLWTMPVDGGEPERLTEFPGGVSDPRSSPDGRWIAVTSEIWPECGADPECNEERDKQAKDNKLSVHVADELLHRHWTAWSDGKQPHVLLVDAHSGEIARDLTPGTFPSPTFSLGGDRGYDFSPDGEHLVFVSNHDERQAESTNADLWLVPTGEEAPPRNLTEGKQGWDGAPLYSPDGRHLAFISQETAGYESDLRRLAVLELESGEIRHLTSRDGFDDMVGDMRWSQDGASLLFQVEQEGRTPVYRISIAGDVPELVHRP
jgi:Tol biopolymer transport system component